MLYECYGLLVRSPAFQALKSAETCLVPSFKPGILPKYTVLKIIGA
jgi:hypothetical protein